jgi:hypothetical protein
MVRTHVVLVARRVRNEGGGHGGCRENDAEICGRSNVGQPSAV